MATTTATDHLPVSFDRRTVGVGISRIAVPLVALGAAALLVPGLGDAVGELGHASAGWMALAAGLEILSCASYVLLFRPIFGDTLSWRSSSRIALSGLGANSVVSAGGAAGIAVGAWALRREGLEARLIASRSVALFVLTSVVNFAAVAVIGLAMATGITGHRYPVALSLVPALAAVAGAAVVALVPWLTRARTQTEGAPKPRTRLRTAAAVLADGVRDSGTLLARHDGRLIAGIVGYWAFDNAVLLAAFHAIGAHPAVAVVLMSYLLGQLGNLLPTPGGFGGADGGMIGLFAAFSVPVQTAVLAVLIYRAWLLLVPALLAVPAVVDLRRWAVAGSE